MDNQTQNYFTNSIDIEKREQLLKLFDDWKQEIQTKDKILWRKDNRKYEAIEYFNCDGFMPGYFSAPKKVLFIAREARWASGQDRIQEDLYKAFETHDYSMGLFWSRIIYIFYGIRTEGKLEYSEIPMASGIYKEMAEQKDFGYAYMNISKYSNDEDDGASADFNLINRSLTDSIGKRNFIREEIELLDPDIIITGNIWDGGVNQEKLSKIFPLEDFKENTVPKALNGIVCDYSFKLNNKQIRLIDLFHFSARNKSNEEYFYKPVMKLLFNK